VRLRKKKVCKNGKTGILHEERSYFSMRKIAHKNKKGDASQEGEVTAYSGPKLKQLIDSCPSIWY
jgi:hypothetical protein